VHAAYPSPYVSTLTEIRKPANTFGGLKSSVAATALQRRLEEVMSALGWSRADLERHSGASRSLAAQWLGQAERPIRSLGVLPAIKLQNASGYSALWLALGEGPKMLPHQPGAIDSASAELMRLYAQMDLVGRARLLAFADDIVKRQATAPHLDLGQR
jgi:hypothetical protein